MSPATGDSAVANSRSRISWPLSVWIGVVVLTFWIVVASLGPVVAPHGEGTLLTTKSCLLNPNRNPGLTQKEIEQRLRDYLGV
jgi:hypothetical protein